MSEPQRADLPTWECYDLVKACTVGRLCFLDGDTPIAYPVSFKLHRTDEASTIVIRTGPGSLMAQYSGPASFEVDDIDVEAHAAWSVLIRGSVRPRLDTAHLPVPDPWIADGRHTWLVLDAVTVSGRRFVGRETGDGYSVEWALDAAVLGPGT